MPSYTTIPKTYNEERKSHLSNQLPLLTTAQRVAITPFEGFMVYDITLDHPFYYNGTAWVQI